MPSPRGGLASILDQMLTETQEVVGTREELTAQGGQAGETCAAKIRDVNTKLAAQEGPWSRSKLGHISPGCVQGGAGSVGDQIGEAGSANQEVPIPCSIEIHAELS